MTTTLPALKDWVDDVARLTQPDNIHWCDGSEAENRQLIEEMCESGTLIPLNKESYPNCYLHRSDPSDVARVEHLTFICTKNREDAGPNNHWMDPVAAKAADRFGIRAVIAKGTDLKNLGDILDGQRCKGTVIQS